MRTARPAGRHASRPLGTYLTSASQPGNNALTSSPHPSYFVARLAAAKLQQVSRPLDQSGFRIAYCGLANPD